MSAMASQITGVSIGCSTVCSGAYQRKYQSSAPLAFVRRNYHRWPVVSPHKGTSNAENVSISWRHHYMRDQIKLVITGAADDLAPKNAMSSPGALLTTFFFSLMRQHHWKSTARSSLAQLTGQSYLINLLLVHAHDDVIKRKHFPRSWPFVQGIHRSPVNSPHKGQWRGALMFSLICDRINGWVNNGEAGDLRRHRAHYDVIVMRDQ